MDTGVVWILVFGIFVTIVFVIGIFYTLHEFKELREPEQRKEHDERRGANVDEEGEGKR